MRIVVVTCPVLFVADPVDALADRLVSAFSVHDPRSVAARVRLPVSASDERAAEQALAVGLIDLQASAHRLVCVGGRAAMVKHTQKRVWLVEEGLDEPKEVIAAGLHEAREVFVTDAATDVVAAAGLQVRPLAVPEGASGAESWRLVVKALRG